MNKKIITLLFTSILLVSCSSGDNPTSETSSTSQVSQSTVTSSETSSEELSSEEISSEEEISAITNLEVTDYEVRHTDIQLTYLDSGNYLDTTPYVGNLSKSAPNPVHISWDEAGESDYIVHIYEDDDLENEVVSYVTSTNSFDFFNTKLGQKYNIVVSSADESVEPSSAVSFVSDARGPRNLFVDGVENVRDLAGLGHIKQGMIYRSGRFNQDKEDIVVSISEDGIYEMVNHLKIKTEIDLRRITNNEVGGLTDTSVLGESVNYIQLPMAFGGNNILTFVGKIQGDTTIYDNPTQIAAFFDLLADENNYPIDFHCSIGKDRTGCLSYLVEGLMGVSEEELMLDYMFTNFANAGYCKPVDITQRYVKTLKDYEKGETMQEKIYNYLNEVVEIPSTTLDKVIEILKVE